MSAMHGPIDLDGARFRRRAEADLRGGPHPCEDQDLALIRRIKLGPKAPPLPRRGVVYFVEAVGVARIKIGWSSFEDVTSRIEDLQTGCPFDLRLLGVMPGSPQHEGEIQRRFARAHARGEWFHAEPALLAFIEAASKTAETEKSP